MFRSRSVIASQGDQRNSNGGNKSLSWHWNTVCTSMAVSESWINAYGIHTQENDVNRTLKLVHIQFFPIPECCEPPRSRRKIQHMTYIQCTIIPLSIVARYAYVSWIDSASYISHNQHAFCSCLLNSSFKLPSPFYLKVKSCLIMIIIVVRFSFFFVWWFLFC